MEPLSTQIKALSTEVMIGGGSAEPTSLSRRGNCWENAVAESFSSSLKKERVRKHIYKSRKLAIEDVSDYIDAFYNPIRRHQHLGGVSPNEFETAAKQPNAGVQ